MFEALNWAVAIDEGIAERWAPDGELLRWRWRERVPGADSMVVCALCGIAYITDGQTRCGLTGLGLSYQRRFRLPSFEWRWRRFEELPDGRADSRNEAAYRTRLAQRPARKALHELASAFTYVGPLIDPPGPSAPRRAPR